MGKESKSIHCKKMPLIDASTKSELTVIAEDQELSMEEYEKEVERTRRSLEQIRQEYALNSAVERVQSRRLIDICRAYLNQVNEKREWKMKSYSKGDVSKDESQKKVNSSLKVGEKH